MRLIYQNWICSVFRSRLLPAGPFPGRKPARNDFSGLNVARHRGTCGGMLKPRCTRDALKDRDGFRDALADWFAAEGRDYPWRRTREPYAILVSEVMLQQTQIATVLGRGFYTRFLETFPDVESLAAADDAPLLKAWEGLGYYRRVRMLRDTARAVISAHGGKFPDSLEALLALPGVGRYTAGALRSFAFDQPAAVVDGNVARVLSRLLDYSGPVDDTAGIRQLWEWAEKLADPARPRVYNSALMELGQKVCRPGVPDCLACPVATYCRTREPELLPVKKQKISITAVDEHALWIRDGKGRLLLHRESGKRREGLWKLPTREAAEISHLPVLDESTYTITRYRVTLRVHDGSALAKRFIPGADESWHAADALVELAMPSPFRRAVTRLSGEI
ncbi:MAG: A/G-specific adenine glycosylase [Verrucomicrobiaceae bacterium]|nr:MAG: A/G-specific adenine glycosylase [Verrucomicrobiaceae bacterium]